MFASVATSVARPALCDGATSTSVAVAVPVRVPADRPDRIRPRSSGARPPATRKTTALTADSASPSSSTARRPISSDSPPSSSAQITPAA
jgi:hypothetical protein